MEHRGQHREATLRAARRVVVAALAVGGLSATTVATGAADAASNHQVKQILLSTATDAQLGTILVSGTTVYTVKPSRTACGTQCLKIWPEVLLPRGQKKAKVGPGVNAARLGTIKRRGGALQVTYSGKPLYWFYNDTAAGQVNGMLTDEWGKWSVIVTATSAGASQSPASGATTVPTSSPNTVTTSPPSPQGAPTSPPPTSPPPTSPPPTSPPPPTTSPGTGGVGF